MSERKLKVYLMRGEGDTLSRSLYTLSSSKIKDCLKFAFTTLELKAEELYAVSSDKLLDFEKTLDDLNIEGGSDIYFWPTQVQGRDLVYLHEDPKLGNKFYAFKYGDYDTVGSAKKFLEVKTGIKKENFLLRLPKEWEEMILRDDMPINSINLMYGFHEEYPIPFIILEPIKFVCVAEWAKKSKEVQFQGQYKVGDVLMSACESFPHAIGGVLTENNDEIVVTFDGQRMKLDTTLSEYGLKNGSEVHFWSKFQGPTKIFLEQFRGDKFFAVEVEMAFPVGLVKDMVADKYGVSREHLALEYNGVHLANESETLGGAGISDGCKVNFHVSRIVGSAEDRAVRIDFDGNFY